MLLLLILWPFVVQGSFESNLAISRIQHQAGDWQRAAASLDAAYSADRSLFDANNLHYLRGRAAENQSDWSRAATEFESIPPEPDFARWRHGTPPERHSSSGQYAACGNLTGRTTCGFSRRTQDANRAGSSDSLSLTIYSKLNSREARFQRARIQNDRVLLWTLLRERNSDDIAAECARLLADENIAPRDSLDLGKAFLAQRNFANAIAFLQRSAIDPAIAAESWYRKAAPIS
jgi:tetratricopeptide (TPR) repeat protein